MVQGYCLKERKHTEIKDPVYELNKKNRPVVFGKCSSCGGKIYKILKASETPADLKEKAEKKKGGASKKSRKSKKSTSAAPTRRKKSKASKSSKKSTSKKSKKSASRRRKRR